jgi:hypothetical protein
LLNSKIVYHSAQQNGYVEWLQKWLGKAKTPDYGVLKDYAERVTIKTRPGIMVILADAAVALSVNAVEAYISRGDRSVGIRAFEGSPPFVLIGGSHIERDSDFFMTDDELRFAIAAEMAHLRFKHTRLTSSELWDGVFYKGKQILDVLSAMAGPLAFLGNAVKGIKHIGDAEKLLRKAAFITEGFKKAADYVGVAGDIQQTATKIIGTETAQAGDGISHSGEQLLAACRIMQLTADRAGLVICGNLQAAIRAIFLIARPFRLELTIAEQHGLAYALARRDPNGKLINRELAVRIAALFSFYLSDDYILLRDALVGNNQRHL